MFTLDYLNVCKTNLEKIIKPTDGFNSSIIFYNPSFEKFFNSFPLSAQVMPFTIWFAILPTKKAFESWTLSCDLLWSVEWGRSDSVPLQSLENWGTLLISICLLGLWICNEGVMCALVHWSQEEDKRQRKQWVNEWDKLRSTKPCLEELKATDTYEMHMYYCMPLTLGIETAKANWYKKLIDIIAKANWSLGVLVTIFFSPNK